MSYQDMLAMPVRAFWVMVNNIPRVTAERELRTLTLHVSAQSAEASKEYRQQLEKDMGEVVRMKRDAILDPEPDREGIEWLKGEA